MLFATSCFIPDPVSARPAAAVTRRLFSDKLFNTHNEHFGMFEDQSVEDPTTFCWKILWLIAATENWTPGWTMEDKLILIWLMILTTINFYIPGNRLVAFSLLLVAPLQMNNVAQPAQFKDLSFSGGIDRRLKPLRQKDINHHLLHMPEALWHDTPGQGSLHTASLTESIKDGLTRYDVHNMWPSGRTAQDIRTSNPGQQEVERKFSSMLRLINVDTRAVSDVAMHHWEANGGTEYEGQQKTLAVNTVSNHWMEE